LLSDARLLVEGGRLSSARFLLTTSREEVAKSYILVDACRLDLRKDVSVLHKLCKAFYDHIFKHAYMEVLHVYFPIIDSMTDAKYKWESEVQRWWPGSPEYGEPDMPHRTYFDREFPLYIDYGDYDRCWQIPTDSIQIADFRESFGETPISNTEKLIEPWRRAESVGLCSPEVLAILNATFNEHNKEEHGTWAQLLRLYKEVAQRVAADKGIAPTVFMDSPFVKWPLYHFV